jgi:hypothetical protein
LHRDYPGVVIELLPPDRHVSLARRDAAHHFVTVGCGAGRRVP